MGVVASNGKVWAGNASVGVQGFQEVTHVDPGDLPLDDRPHVAHPDITDDEHDLFTRGNCGILAYRLAKMNGWGMRMYGELDLSDVDDGYDLAGHDPDDYHAPYIGVEELWHAYAVRPDGQLVDVKGVHDPDVADEIYDGHTRWDYATADECDRLWNHEQWLGSDVADFGFGFDDFDDELAHADEVARLVTEGVAAAR